MIQSLDAPASSLSLSQTSSDNRFGDMKPTLLRTHRRLLTRKEYSVRIVIRKLEQVATHWNATLFHLVYGSDCLQTGLFFCICETAVGIVSRVEFANASQVQLSYGKLLPHSAASNYLYLFVWINLCMLFMLYFKPSFSNRAETELKRQSTDIILSCASSWCLATFSINMSCDSRQTQSAALFWLQNENIVLYRVSQDECARLREGVPYVKVYRYNPKHLCKSGTFTEIMAREKCGLLVGPRTVPVGLQCYPCRPCV